MTIASAYVLTQGFAVMVRERRGERLDAWLVQVGASGIAELAGFARGIVDDQAPVAAALSLEWSNGQTEGQVNKLKLLKCSRYGRAKFDLLRQRLLSSA